MWNENAPLELLKELPAVLNEANLARIQSVIDYDKFINSSESGYDLCGKYAPFCKICDKSVSTPCAVAYVRMMQSRGYNVEMLNIPSLPEKQAEEEAAQPQTLDQPVEEVVKEQPKTSQVDQKEQKATPAKKRLRIAVAKKRNQN